MTCLPIPKKTILLLCLSLPPGLFSSHILAQSPAAAKRDTSAVLALLDEGDRFKTDAPDRALAFYENGKRLADSLHWTKGRGEYIRHIIQVYNNQGKYNEALSLCREAVSIASHGGSLIDAVRAYNNLANEFQYLGNLSAASEHYLQAARLAQSLPDRKYLKVIDNNLASLFFQMGQYEKCHAYATESYRIAREGSDPQGMALSLVNLGVSEIHLNASDEALRHFSEVLDLSHKLDDYTFACDAYVNRASIHMNRHQPALAQQEYEAVLRLAQANGNPNYEVLGLAGLSDVASARERWDESGRYLHRALSIAEPLGDGLSLVQLYDKAARVAERKGDWKSALSFRNRYVALNDSLLSAKTRAHINELEIRYQGARKDHQLAQQRLLLERSDALVRARNRQLVLLAAGLGILLLILLLGWRLFRQRQKLHRQAHEALEKDREMALLKGVVQGQESERQRIAREMHDDMGTGLTTILYLGQGLESTASPGGNNAAQKIVHTASALVETMNEIVWSMNRQHDTLDDLVAYLRHRAGALLENSGREYEMNLPDTVPPIALRGEVRRNIYLVVKEALNNALKHSGASRIALSLSVDAALRITVSDDGRGMAENSGNRWGHGLTHMRERMQSIGGSLNLITGAGTTVVLELPLDV